MSGRDYYRDRDDFDRRMASMRRARERQFRILWIFIAVVMLVAFGCAIGALYLVVTTSPEQVGAYVGHIIAGFRSAA